MGNVIGSSLDSRPGSRRLCILAGRPVRAREFVETLQLELNPGDELEVIPDRRRSAGRPPSVDRRRQRSVDSWLKKHAFAIVPVADASERSGRRSAPPPAVAPTELGAAPDVDSDAARLAHVRRDERRRKIKFGLQLTVGGLAGVVIGVTLANVLLPTVASLLGQVRATPTAVMPPTQEPPPVVVPVTQAVAAAPAPSVSEPLPLSLPDRVESPAVARPPDRRAETELPTVSRPLNRGAERPREARAPSLAGPRPLVVSSLPDTAPSRPLASQSGGLPTVEMERRAAPEGGGETYALRLRDTAGQRLADAEVSLFIRMADGALLDLPVGAGPEPGTYQVTVPPLRSAPVDVRVRIATSDARVEIPLPR
jgi:hypothetical protein